MKGMYLTFMLNYRGDFKLSHLLTPKFKVKGIIAAHFDTRPDQGRKNLCNV